MFTDVIQQLLHQAIEGKDQGFVLRRRVQLPVKTAANAALREGEFIHQMVQCFFQRQFIQHRRAQLAQQLASGVMNASRQLVDLPGGFDCQRRVSRAFHQLRLDLNRRNVLADFVVQLAGQVFTGVLFGVDQRFSELPPRL
ncbi:hypothetical protein D3C87_1610040 [compost metagenome]